MKRAKAFRLCLASLLLTCVAAAQHEDRRDSTGTLEVTATVVGSVGVVVTADGQYKVVVANAPDAAFLAQEAITLSQERRRKKAPEGGRKPGTKEKGTKLPGLVPLSISTDVNLPLVLVESAAECEI